MVSILSSSVADDKAVVIFSWATEGSPTKAMKIESSISNSSFVLKRAGLGGDTRSPTPAGV
eukprot:9718945-Prorocentrum_lima.AAC.1